MSVRLPLPHVFSPAASQVQRTCGPEVLPRSAPRRWRRYIARSHRDSLYMPLFVFTCLAHDVHDRFRSRVVQKKNPLAAALSNRIGPGNAHAGYRQRRSWLLGSPGTPSRHRSRRARPAGPRRNAGMLPPLPSPPRLPARTGHSPGNTNLGHPPRLARRQRGCSAGATVAAGAYRWARHERCPGCAGAGGGTAPASGCALLARAAARAVRRLPLVRGLLLAARARRATQHRNRHAYGCPLAASSPHAALC